jgi:hypothetical protein
MFDNVALGGYFVSDATSTIEQEAVGGEGIWAVDHEVSHIAGKVEGVEEEEEVEEVGKEQKKMEPEPVAPHSLGLNEVNVWLKTTGSSAVPCGERSAASTEEQGPVTTLLVMVYEVLESPRRPARMDRRWRRHRRALVLPSSSLGIRAPAVLRVPKGLLVAGDDSVGGLVTVRAEHCDRFCADRTLTMRECTSAKVAMEQRVRQWSQQSDRATAKNEPAELTLSMTLHRSSLLFFPLAPQRSDLRQLVVRLRVDDVGPSGDEGSVSAESLLQIARQAWSDTSKLEGRVTRGWREYDSFSAALVQLLDCRASEMQKRRHRQYTPVPTYQHKQPVTDKYVTTGKDGNAAILSVLQKGAAAAIGKIGHTELMLVWEVLSSPERMHFEYGHRAHVWSGIFPAEKWLFEAFADLFLVRLQDVDVLGWWREDELAAPCAQDFVVGQHSPKSVLVPLMSFSPYCFAAGAGGGTIPWSAALLNKRVLVVHPFAETIKAQYANHRRLLWRNADGGACTNSPADGEEGCTVGNEGGVILPEFASLETITPPQSAGLVPPAHADWLAALRHLQQKMEGVDFDVALIGAGAFGLPLAVHAKRLGKIGIHTGGDTQVLFGIKGRRYEMHNKNYDACPGAVGGFVSTFYNDFWRRPAPEETPLKKDDMEGGCYW